MKFVESVGGTKYKETELSSFTYKHLNLGVTCAKLFRNSAIVSPKNNINFLIFKYIRVFFTVL